MSSKLLTYDFAVEFYDLLRSTKQRIRIVSPFIGYNTATELAKWIKTNNVECTLITRFYREDFIQNASSLLGLESLLQAGVTLRAIKNLHTKLYIFDEESVILGSANFTYGGFYLNHEINVLFQNEPDVIPDCIRYFEDLWNVVGNHPDGIITERWIEEEKYRVEQAVAKRKGKSVKETDTNKRGVDLQRVAIRDDLESALTSTISKDVLDTGIWLKFEGRGDDRVPKEMNFEQMKGRKSREWELTYFPKGNRPTGIKQGDVIYLGVVSYDKAGYPTPMIIGRATTPGFKAENEATDNEINSAPWKAHYRYFIELTDGIVVDAPIAEGISLSSLVSELGNMLYPTTRNLPDLTAEQLKKRYYEKSHLRITKEAAQLIDKKLQVLLNLFGEVRI